MKTGADLIRDIDSADIPHGALRFWWLGQLSFVVKTCRTVIYLDPYLTPNPARRVPPLLAPGEIVHADIVTGSHDHSDHIDRPALPALMAASARAVVVIPRAAQVTVERLGIPRDRIRLMDDGVVLEEQGLRITAVKAAHELLDFSPVHGYPYLGFIFEGDGVAFYHSGDTCIYEGLVTRLQAWKLTVAFLPINGRDAERLRRKCIGNMTYQEAVDLAGAIRPALTVPAHYDMFAGNSADPKLFADYMDVKYPGLRYWIGEHGEGVEVRA